MIRLTENSPELKLFGPRSPSVFAFNGPKVR
jgi:hypothetical protein